MPPSDHDESTRATVVALYRATIVCKCGKVITAEKPTAELAMQHAERKLASHKILPQLQVI